MPVIMGAMLLIHGHPFDTSQSKVGALLAALPAVIRAGRIDPVTMLRAE
jgi:hypothetical protein